MGRFSMVPGSFKSKCDMVRPRRVEFEFDGLNGESYIYWDHYAEALEIYANHLEEKQEPEEMEVVDPEEVKGIYDKGGFGFYFSITGLYQ